MQLLHLLLGFGEDPRTARRLWKEDVRKGLCRVVGACEISVLLLR